MFNANDPIFSRKRDLDADEREEVEEWSRCGCCGDSTKKLKSCNFCGQLACPVDLNHQRPYPFDNPNKQRIATQVCLTCDFKFLYRDAMFELLSKIEGRDMELKIYQEELSQQELHFDSLNSKLTKQKTERAKLTQIIAVDKAELLTAREDCEIDLLDA